MKLQDLFERIGAPVHVNDEKTLTVISSLIEKTFGIELDNIDGGCLVTQVIYSIIHAIPEATAQDVINVLNKSKLKSGLRGVTLKQLFNFFNKPITLKDKRVVKFNLSVSVHTPQEVMNEIKLGFPVICIPSSELWDATEKYDENGIIKISDGDLIETSPFSEMFLYHAFLMIGYDEKYFIWRDSRDLYSYNGYIKIPKKELLDNPKACHYMSIYVDSVKITQPSKS